MNFFGKKTSHFILAIAFLFLILLLNFIFFYPKFGVETNSYETLNYLGEKNTEEIKEILSNTLEPGDIIADKPLSFRKSYGNALKNREGPIRNIFLFTFYYNLFDKVFVTSMGEDGYWHVYIYLGNGTLNSLDEDGSSEDFIDDYFIENGDFEIYKIKTLEENKQKAIKRAIIHEQKKDVPYSLKNGVLIVFSKSTGIFPFQKLEENKFVCSSYLASIYKEISFNPNKHFTYISPADIKYSGLTETVFVKNENGVYIK